MKIIYKNSKIKKICNDERKAIKAFGLVVSNRLILLLNALESATNLKDILMLTQYHLHKLKGEYKFEYSLYLGKTTGYRLIITPLDENELNIKDEEMSFYEKAVCVRIEEVSKHYE